MVESNTLFLHLKVFWGKNVLIKPLIPHSTNHVEWTVPRLNDIGGIKINAIYKSLQSQILLATNIFRCIIYNNSTSYQFCLPANQRVQEMRSGSWTDLNPYIFTLTRLTEYCFMWLKTNYSMAERVSVDRHGRKIKKHNVTKRDGVR